MINRVLPPGLQFTWSSGLGMFPMPQERTFTTMTVRQLLDAMTTLKHARWSFMHRRLVVAYGTDAVIPPGNPRDGPVYGDVAGIRTCILTWAGSGTGSAAALEKAYHCISNSYDFQGEIPALAADQEVTTAVAGRLKRDLDRRADLSCNELLLAGDLHLVDFARPLADRLSLLSMHQMYELAVPDWRHFGMQRGLITQRPWGWDWR